MLDDPVTAQYTHTLTLTERLEGQYQCTVANNKPSNATAQFTLQGALCKEFLLLFYFWMYTHFNTPDMYQRILISITLIFILEF